MSNRFDIVISAVDKASKPIANINRNLEKMMRPMERLNRAFKNMGKELHMDKASSGLSKFSAGMAKASAGFGIGSPLVRGAAGGLALAGLVETISKLTTNLGGYGTTITRIQQRAGVGFKASQRLRGAAKLMGLSPESMDSGLSNLSDTMRNAQFGPQAAALSMLFTKLGVKPIMGKDGNPDVAAMLPRMADAVARQKNPATAAAILNEMGLGELFPLLRGGAKELERRAKEAERAGAVLSDDDVKKTEAFGRSVDLLRLNFEGLSNRIGLSMMPATQSFIDWLNRFAADQNGPPSKPYKPRGVNNPPGFFESLLPDWLVHVQGNRGRHSGMDFAPGTTASKLFDRFRSYGWSAAQANGIVANLQAESGLNPGITNKDGVAYGLAQWRGDRQARFKAWSGKDIHGSTLEQQADFINYELTKGGEQAAGDALRGAVTAQDAARIVSLQYERPGGGQAEADRRADLIDHDKLGQTIVAALKQAPVQVTVKAGGSPRLSYAMPSDGVR